MRLQFGRPLLLMGHIHIHAQYVAAAVDGASAVDTDAVDGSASDGRSVFVQLVGDGTVRRVVLIFALFAFSSTASVRACIGWLETLCAQDEMYSLWLAEPYALGGVGWTQMQSANPTP